jgi:hypothetical protein
MPLFRERVEIFREQHGKLEEEVVVVGFALSLDILLKEPRFDKY